MSDIIKFDFEGKPVRTVETGGVTQWVAKDVCEVLNIAKHRDAVARLEEDERGSVVVDTLGGPQEMASVTESGLYALIFRSRKPVARRFRKWVTSKVLPEIRRKGYYALEGRISALLERVIELDSPQLRKCEAADIRRRVRTISVLRNGEGRVSKLVAFRRVDNELRGRVSYPTSNGHRWESFPRHRLGDVLLALDEMEAEDISLLRSQARHAAKLRRQQDLRLN